MVRIRHSPLLVSQPSQYETAWPLLCLEYCEIALHLSRVRMKLTGRHGGWVLRVQLHDERRYVSTGFGADTAGEELTGGIIVKMHWPSVLGQTMEDLGSLI